jgi:hypothetical protein
MTIVCCQKVYFVPLFIPNRLKYVTVYRRVRKITKSDY